MCECVDTGYCTGGSSDDNKCERRATRIIKSSKQNVITAAFAFNVHRSKINSNNNNRTGLGTCGAEREEVTGEWRKLRNEELNDLYCLSYIVR